MKCAYTKDVRFINDRFAHLRAIGDGQEQVDAVLDGDADLQLDSGGWSDDAPAQGELVQPSEQKQDDDSDCDSADDETVIQGESDAEEEYKIDKIVERKSSRGGAPMYHVRWDGYGEAEDTWETSEAVKDCAALDAFERDNPPPPPRRSPRHEADSGQQPDATGSDFDNDDGSASRAEMAMVALRGYSATGEWIDEEPLRQTIAAAAVDSRSVSERTPNTLAEAMKSDDAAKWQAERQKEYDSCIALGVWTEMDRESLPKRTNVLPLKEVFKIKVDEDGKIVQFN